MKWKQGIPISYLEGKWQELLNIIQVYNTYEGRYARTMFYHFTLLLHFTCKKPLNMPYYLLRSLTKMDSKVQDKPQEASNILFHHGLIKLIVLEEIRKRNKTWSYLFFGSEFEQEAQPQGEGTSSQQVKTPKISKRKKREMSFLKTIIESSSSKPKRTKMKLKFGKETKGQRQTTSTNILKLAYSYSDSKQPVTEVEVPKKGIPEISPKKKVSKQSKVKKIEKESCRAASIIKVS